MLPEDSFTTGKSIYPSNLRCRIGIPALEKTCIEFREMKQARHAFATIALSCGENPLWIAKVIGYRDTNMIIKVYSKYVENVSGSEDVFNLDGIYQGIKITKGKKDKKDLWKNFAKKVGISQKKG